MKQEHVNAIVDAILQRGLRFAVAVRNTLNARLRDHVSLWHLRGDKTAVRCNLGTNRILARIVFSFEHGTGNRKYHAFCPAKEFRGMFDTFDEAATVCDVHLQQQRFTVAVPRGPYTDPFNPTIMIDYDQVEMRP